MDAQEVRLKCLELAMTQARLEGQHASIDRVAEITTRFYNLTLEAPTPDKSHVFAPITAPTTDKPRTTRQSGPSSEDKPKGNGPS